MALIHYPKRADLEPLRFQMRPERGRHDVQGDGYWKVETSWPVRCVRFDWTRRVLAWFVGWSGPAPKLAVAGRKEWQHSLLVARWESSTGRVEFRLDADRESVFEFAASVLIALDGRGCLAN